MYIGNITSKRGVHKRKFKYSAQTGSAWHWTYVIRAKNADKRKLIAKGMENAIANSKLIKYSNASKKNTALYNAVKPYKFDCRKLKKKTTVNCSALASICARYAGYKTPRRSSSLTIHKTWKDKGFKVLKYKKGMKLYRGDVLISTTRPSPHTAVVL